MTGQPCGPGGKGFDAGPSRVRMRRTSSLSEIILFEYGHGIPLLEDQIELGRSESGLDEFDSSKMY